jgi:HEAT repeat protein
MTSLEEYVGKLGCTDETERTYAAEDLGYLNAPEAVPALLERLRHEPSLTVRDAIFQALSRTDGDAPIKASVQLLESEDPQIRNQAVIVLRGKGARVIPFLNALMRTGDRRLRKLVLDALSGVQMVDAGEIYASALRDQDPNVVITAVENIGGIRAAEFRNRIEELLRLNSHPMLTAACLEALVGIGGASSLEAIRRCFPDLAVLPDFLLASCLKAFAALGSAREFPEVANLLLVRGHHLRPAILGALKGIHSRCPLDAPPQKLVSTLQAVIENGDPPLCRYQAVQALGLWAGRDDICTLLVSCLTSEERLIRLAAAESLRAAKRPDLHRLLAERAREESDEEVLQALTC